MAAGVCVGLGDRALGLHPFAGPVLATVDAGWVTLIAAGLLVGVGTRYGAGCTSGHGVCGLSRLSPARWSPPCPSWARVLPSCL